MGPRNAPALSPAQQEIMELVWDRGELSAFEVREALADDRTVARETVRTMLTRMEEKGWLKHRVVGRTYFYSAAIPREANLGQSVVELIDNLCGGSAEKLMTALLDHRGLSDEEAKRIQSMIESSKARKTNQSRRR